VRLRKASHVETTMGYLDFRYLRFNGGTRIIVTRVPEDNSVLLFLDQHLDGRGVLGAGDCEIGFNKANIERLLKLIQRIMSITPAKTAAWQSVGEAEFSWSDHNDRSESGEDYGLILIESNSALVRLVIRTKAWTKNWAENGGWAPYVATFSNDVLPELSRLLSRALHQS
jgi:hypothetical protein